MKEFMKAKRGFSQVVAALILMLIAVATGVVVYGYIMGWIGGATGSTGGQRGQLQFDSIYATASDDVIKIYLRNTGSKDLILYDGVYIQGAKHTNTTLFGTTSLPVGSVLYLEIDTTGTLDLQAAYNYEVTVTCTDGTKASQSVEAK